MGVFSNLFGFRKKRDETFRGETPVSIEDTAQGKLLGKTLEERLAGRGVGFRPGFLEKATTPFAIQARAGLKEETIPRISAEASARGLGRSTIPVNRIALESVRTERDISEYVGQVSLMNEQQRRVEINDALTKYVQFTGDVVAGANLKQQFKYADYLFQIGRRDEAEKLNTAALQKVASLVATVAGGVIGGPVGAGISLAGQNIGGYSSSQVAGTSLTDLLAAISAKTASSVPIASSTISKNFTPQAVGRG